METLTPLQIAGIVVGLIIGVISVIGTLAAIIYWLTKIEQVTKNNAEDIAGLVKHTEDRSIHPSATDLDRRFGEFHTDLTEIKQGVQQGFVEVNRRLDTVLSK